MFDEKDFISFWSGRKGYAELSRREVVLEKANKDSYGLHPVPIVFFDSTDKKGLPTIISKTPVGKIIFPGPDMAPRLQTGVLFRDLCLQHRGQYCITVGIDYRTEAYWKEVMNQRKIQAIKEYRASSGLGLKESKAITDVDFLLVWGQPQPNNNNYIFGQSPLCQPSGNPRGSQLHGQIDYQRKIDDAVNSAHHYLSLCHNLERQVDKLEDELAETLIQLADEIDRNKNSQPPSSNNFNINIWEIIECQPGDDYDIIEASIKNAIRLYHPDMVNRCGVLLQELSTEITSQLLLFRKQLRRKL